MKLLSKIGQIILKAGQLYLGFAGSVAGPQATQIVNNPIITNALHEIYDLIVLMESIGQALQLPGTSKLTGITPAVSQIILKSLGNAKIKDPVLFQQGCQKIADGAADILNSLEDKVDTSSKT